MVKRNLLIYNLETNLDSHVLASAHDWIEEFSKHYANIFVYTTHAGKTNLPENVKVIETGGGSFKARLLAIIKLAIEMPWIFKIRKNTDVFHHMSSKTLFLLGLPIKLMKIPQIIWYSHSVADFALRNGARFADLLVSSTLQTVPDLKGISKRALGHGISLARIGEIPEYNSNNREGIVCVGRVVSIKKIEDVIYAITNLDIELRKKVKNLVLVGPFEESDSYYKFLLQKCLIAQLELVFFGPIEYVKIPKLLCNSSILFTGTPKSADKAALEGAMLGCLILTTNKSVQELTGMDRVLPNEEISTNLTKQLTWMLSLSETQQTIFREVVATTSRELNSLENLVVKVVECFEEIRRN